MTTATTKTETMQAQRWDDRALKMDTQACTRMSWGSHSGQWQKRVTYYGADRGHNNQPLMRAVSEGKQQLVMRV